MKGAVGGLRTFCETAVGYDLVIPAEAGIPYSIFKAFLDSRGSAELAEDFRGVTTFYELIRKDY